MENKTIKDIIDVLTKVAIIRDLNKNVFLVVDDNACTVKFGYELDNKILNRRVNNYNVKGKVITIMAD